MHIRATRQLPPSTHLKQNLGCIKSWLFNCERDHSTCNMTTSFRPLRLLDVQNPSIVELVETVEFPPNLIIRYACLSHCWGKTRCIHLTKMENLNANKAGIRVEELPRTFRDAISIARALDIQYLWIDSFCIIQDSETDWSDHVDVMAAIYENAYITLAAGASEDDEGGFFREVPEAYQTLSIELDMGTQLCHVYLRQAVEHPVGYWSLEELLPLMKRGWYVRQHMIWLIY